MHFLTQPRIVVFTTCFLTTLAVYILRGLGYFSFIPGMVLLILIGLSIVTLLFALRPPRRWW
jgi:hypothetical protein